jgi:hypothetical protein
MVISLSTGGNMFISSIRNMSVNYFKPFSSRFLL